MVCNVNTHTESGKSMFLDAKMLRTLISKMELTTTMRDWIKYHPWRPQTFRPEWGWKFMPKTMAER